MFCHIYKWLISKAWDKEKSSSGFLDRHLRRCASCREYARFLESIHHRFAQDTHDFLTPSHPALNEKIISALDKDIKHKTLNKKATRPIMLPAIAASLLVLIIMVGLIFKVSPFQNRVPAESSFPRLDIPTAPVINFFSEMESPYEKEFLDLKETVKSTAAFLISRLDVNIGRQ